MSTPEREALAELLLRARKFLKEVDDAPRDGLHVNVAYAGERLERYFPKAEAAIAAALSSQPPAPSWQPIETAPKDGNSFLSLNRNQGNLMAVTWWSHVRNYFCATGGKQLYQFTHWMHLPSTSSTEGAAG